MLELVRSHPRAFLLVLVLHGLLFAGFFLNVSLPSPSSSPSALEITLRDEVEVIDAVAIEADTFDRMEEQERRAAEEQRLEEERRQREAEEQARREAEEQARREAEEQARREAEEQAQREAEEQARREAEEQARREAEEQARREAEEQARRERELEEQLRQERLEAERQRLAEEEARREAAARQAALDEAMADWRAQVQSVVQRRWRQPSDVNASDRANVLVRINETGRIIAYDIESCSGGSRFCDSVQQTMDRLSSLPRPPDADSARGGVLIRFEPE